MENITDSREEKRALGAEEQLSMHLRDALPENIGLAREGIAGLIGDYVREFQGIYSIMEHDDPRFTFGLSMELTSLKNRTRQELKILDQLIPIAGSPEEVIPWDVSEQEAAINRSGIGRGNLPWSRFVDAVGKRMSRTHPLIPADW